MSFLQKELLLAREGELMNKNRSIYLMYNQ